MGRLLSGVPWQQAVAPFHWTCYKARWAPLCQPAQTQKLSLLKCPPKIFVICVTYLSWCFVNTWTGPTTILVFNSSWTVLQRLFQYMLHWYTGNSNCNVAYINLIKIVLFSHISKGLNKCNVCNVVYSQPIIHCCAIIFLWEFLKTIHTYPFWWCS